MDEIALFFKSIGDLILNHEDFCFAIILAVALVTLAAIINELGGGKNS